MKYKHFNCHISQEHVNQYKRVKWGKYLHRIWDTTLYTLSRYRTQSNQYKVQQMNKGYKQITHGKGNVNEQQTHQKCSASLGLSRQIKTIYHTSSIKWVNFEKL